MRIISMCISLVQYPQWRWNLLANSCWGTLHRLGRIKGRSSFRTLCSNYDLEGGYIRRYTRKTSNAKSGGSNRSLGTTPEVIAVTRTKSSSSKLGAEKTEGSRKLSRKLIISRSAAPMLTTYDVETTGTEPESDQHYIDLAQRCTVICFDIETTGFSREKDRIVEFACQDLRGGEYSTFQTLINPERDVPNEGIHGISTRMVNRSDVPRMKDFIPILLEYLESRRIPGGNVILVSHNGRTFDVPFLKKEFSRCSYELPPYCLFVDTCQLARSLSKSLGDQAPTKHTLQALREYYNIPLIGSAHRALSDVNVLALVLQRLTFDLKMPVWKLIQQCFE